MQIRAANLADAEAIHHLVVELSDDFFIYPDRRGSEGFFNSVSIRAISDYLSDTRYRYWLAQDPQGLLLGLLALRDASHVFHLFVRASHQGQGVASQLWRTALSYLQEHGNTVEITVNSSVRAAPSYQHWGFRATTEVQSKDGLRFLPMSRQRN